MVTLRVGVEGRAVKAQNKGDTVPAPPGVQEHSALSLPLEGSCYLGNFPASGLVEVKLLWILFVFPQEPCQLQGWSSLFSLAQDSENPAHSEASTWLWEKEMGLIFLKT